MLKQVSMIKRYCAPFAGLMLACNFAIAQNWVPSGTSVPFDAVVVGSEKPLSLIAPKVPLYSCRGGEREGYGLQLGYFRPGTTTCNFSYGGLEIQVSDFQLLVTSWQTESGGVIPPNAVVGNGSFGSPLAPPPLYICRGEVGEGPLQRPPQGPSHCNSARSVAATQAASYHIPAEDSCSAPTRFWSRRLPPCRSAHPPKAVASCRRTPSTPAQTPTARPFTSVQPFTAAAAIRGSCIRASEAATFPSKEWSTRSLRTSCLA